MPAKKMMADKSINLFITRIVLIAHVYIIILEHVEEREGGLRGTDVDLMAVVHLLAADAAVELVVVDVGGTYAEGGLEVPVTGEHPLIAEADTAAGIPALKTVVAQVLPPAERHLDVRSVVFASKGMDADEGAVETVTEPVAPLRVDHPVLEVLLVSAVAERPRVKAIEKL